MVCTIYTQGRSSRMGTDHRPSQPPRALPSPYLYTLLYTKEATERIARHLLSSRKERYMETERDSRTFISSSLTPSQRYLRNT